MELDDVVAELEIRRALYTYCRGVDRGDAELIAAAYHDDADENHGSFKGTGREFAEYLVPLMDSAPDSSNHNITNVLINRKGNRAHVESYFIVFHALDDGDRAFVTGRYLDRFEQRGSEWKIAERHVVIDADTPATGMLELGDYPRGRRRENDPSHEWMQ